MLLPEPWPLRGAPPSNKNCWCYKGAKLECQIPYCIILHLYVCHYYLRVHTHIFTRPGERDMHVLFSEGCSQIQFVQRYLFGVYMEEWSSWEMGVADGNNHTKKMVRVVRF